MNGVMFNHRHYLVSCVQAKTSSIDQIPDIGRISVVLTVKNNSAFFLLFLVNANLDYRFQQPSFQRFLSATMPASMAF